MELHPGGSAHPLTWETRERYCEEVEHFRLTEMNAVAAAVRRGLFTQLPQAAVQLMRWDALERRVCGVPTVDVDLLKAATQYEGYSESDRVVQWFWEILAEYSQEQRKAYLKFVWGRSRLPLTVAQFSKRMKLTHLSRYVV